MTDDLLVLDRVSKSFGGLEAISGVSLTVPAGAIVALVGAAGAGKTTLFDLITGHCRPDAGTIRFLGRNLAGLRTDQTCAAGIARTFHPVQPFRGLGVADTVMVAALLRAPDPTEARRRVLDLLDLLASAWNWPGRWPPGRGCCCSTKSWGHWHRRKSGGCARCCMPSTTGPA